MECQSTPDGTICIRMFQYDVNIALQYAKMEQHVLKIAFPHSAVIFLRDSSSISDKMTVELHTPGGTISYDMVVLKVANYNLETLFEKKLYFLLPFYAFNLEKEFEKMNHNTELVDTLTARYDYINARLNSLALTGTITSRELTILTEMTKTTLMYLTKNYHNIQKEVTFMGGRILEIPALIAYDKAVEEKIREEVKKGTEIAIKEGRAKGKAESQKQAILNMLDFGISKEQILTKYSEAEYDSAVASMQN